VNAGSRLRNLTGKAISLSLALAIPSVIISATSGQELRDVDRARGQVMLKVIKKELQKYYYDPTFHGLDLEARFKKAEQDIEHATSLGHAYGIIAQALLDLHDSHTLFIPPRRTTKYQYGWQVRMIGETPFVIAVKPDSDAAAKGLKVGDAVLSVDGYPVTRQNLWIMKYRYYTIRPALGMKLVVQSPGGQPRELDVLAKVSEGKRVLDFTEGEDIWDVLREAENAEPEQRDVAPDNENLLIWNMPSFMVTENELKGVVGKLNKFKSVILDLRGNGGGAVKTGAWMLGHFFDRDVTVARPRGRKEKMDPIVAKTHGQKAFSGKLVVLVDSGTGSMAELCARVIQLEKRGTVIGDRTAGAVMQSRYHREQMGGETIVLYGISITESELITGDDKSLENVGVTPDVVVLPTGADLAAGSDPALSRAAELVAVRISPEKAGTFFPYKWTN
jgi:C-terminal processing protease CtpA/Prc